MVLVEVIWLIKDRFVDLKSERLGYPIGSMRGFYEGLQSWWCRG